MIRVGVRCQLGILCVALGWLTAPHGSVAGAPLVEAVEARDLRAVRIALDEGADLRESEPCGTTALHGAVLANQPSFVI